jgi:hypothetical protein
MRRHRVLRRNGHFAGVHAGGAGYVHSWAMSSARHSSSPLRGRGPRVAARQADPAGGRYGLVERNRELTLVPAQLRHHRAVAASFRMPMICPSENCFRFIPPVL